MRMTRKSYSSENEAIINLVAFFMPKNLVEWLRFSNIAYTNKEK